MGKTLIIKHANFFVNSFDNTIIENNVLISQNQEIISGYVNADGIYKDNNSYNMIKPVAIPNNVKSIVLKGYNVFPSYIMCYGNKTFDVNDNDTWGVNYMGCSNESNYNTYSSISSIIVYNLPEGTKYISWNCNVNDTGLYYNNYSIYGKYTGGIDDNGWITFSNSQEQFIKNGTTGYFNNSGTWMTNTNIKLSVCDIPSNAKMIRCNSKINDICTNSFWLVNTNDDFVSGIPKYIDDSSSIGGHIHSYYRYGQYIPNDLSFNKVCVMYYLKNTRWSNNLGLNLELQYK